MTSCVDVIALSKQLCRDSISCELKYATSDNFVGRVISGYDPAKKNVALLTPKVAEKLCAVQNYLIAQHQYGLHIFDAYRPKRAVLDFIAWSHQPPAGAHELTQKEKHYPDLSKDRLFALGYLSEDSQHCYGNTVDCVLRDLQHDRLLEMGTIFDFFGEQSHSTQTADVIGESAYRHRQILLQAMEKFGFTVAKTEYWHFTHRMLREVDTPMDVAFSEGFCARH